MAIEVSFVSTVKDSNEPFTIHIHSENSPIFIRYETDNIIKELFKSVLEECQENLKTKMKRSDFVFNSVDALHYKLHKISLNRRGSYIDSPKWLKDKKAAINSKSKGDNKCFQYAIASNQQINNHPEGIKKINLLLISTIGKQ